MAYESSRSDGLALPPDNSSHYKSPEGYQAVTAHHDAAFQNMGLPYETTYVETHHGVTHAVLTGKADGKGVGHMMVHPQPSWVMDRILAFYERYAV